MAFKIIEAGPEASSLISHCCAAHFLTHALRFEDAEEAFKRARGIITHFSLYCCTLCRTLSDSKVLRRRSKSSRQGQRR